MGNELTAQPEAAKVFLQHALEEIEDLVVEVQFAIPVVMRGPARAGKYGSLDGNGDPVVGESSLVVCPLSARVQGPPGRLTVDDGPRPLQR